MTRTGSKPRPSRRDRERAPRDEARSSTRRGTGDPKPEARRSGDAKAPASGTKRRRAGDPSPPPRRRAGESKSEATRRVLLARALELFQARGVEATTMRDIAQAAGLSLGAAYYYFPSKEALMFAYYEQNQAEMERIADAAARAGGTLRERLAALMHGKLDSIRPQRAMLGAIVARLVDPGDPVGAFSDQTRAVRERAIAIFSRTLESSGGSVHPATIPVVAHALWLLMLAAMLVFVNDTSPHAARTHGLVDDGLDLIVPLLPLLGTPVGLGLCARVTTALERAGIVLA